jgi:hypothetical protein
MVRHTGSADENLIYMSTPHVDVCDTQQYRGL